MALKRNSARGEHSATVVMPTSQPSHPCHSSLSISEMGSLDETLSAMLANDQGYSTTLASVLASSSSNSGTTTDEGVFALQQQGSETSFHRAGALAGINNNNNNNNNRAAHWSFGRDQKWVLDGNTNEALEASPVVKLPPAAGGGGGGGLQRYHSAPSTFLECLADFTDDAFSHVNGEDSDLLDSFFADNLATINERGVQPMDTDQAPKVVSISLNEYEQFVTTQSRSSGSSLQSPSTQSKLASELRSDHGHGGFSTPDARGARSRPTRMNLLRQSSTPGDFLAAVQDTLQEPPGITSPVFKMHSFSRDESTSNITSEGDNGVQSGNRLRSAEMTTEVPGWLGSSSLRVRVGDPTSPMTSKLGLIRHSSLPAASRPFSPTMELDDLAEFSGTVPCKTRANRGFATHPRSIAERVRRTKISERMKKLQELVPNMDRQTNTADMLDEAVEYVKHLQLQVQELSITVVQLEERLVHCS